jgi:hypothetical protein
MSSNETEQSLLFPPKMKVLECFGAQLTVEAAKQIPCSLTLLNILRLDSQVCGALPRHLKSLTVSGCILTPDLIKNIPPFLTNLEMPLIGDSEAWIDVETGQESAYADLVKRKPEKYGHKMEGLSMLWQGEYSLPSTLTHLALQLHDYLDDEFVASLPKRLEFCNLENSLWISDISIPAFSRLLTFLNLRASSMVTGHSFKDLPRQLVFLSLASSEQIFDEHIKDLPRDLKSILLRHAIHLTNSCIKDLPPRTEEFHVELNKLITPDAFPLFPLRMRTAVVYKSFHGAKWVVRNGKIYG